MRRRGWQICGLLAGVLLGPCPCAAIDASARSTPWVGIGSVGALLALLAALHHLRLRQMARQYQARLEQHVAQQNRAAQDLHDTLLQGILSASMHVDLAADSLPADSPAKPLVNRALELIRQVIEEGRQELHNLRSSDSPSLDLGEALSMVQEEVSDNCKNAQRVEFRVVVEGQRRPLHPLLRDEMYRIGREALVNAFRHSRAKRVEVEIKYSSDELRIRVKDDGCGMEAQSLERCPEGHWGLLGMRERAEQIGARLHLWSRARAGTEVEVSAPAHMAFMNPAKPRR